MKNHKQCAGPCAKSCAGKAYFRHNPMQEPDEVMLQVRIYAGAARVHMGEGPSLPRPLVTLTVLDRPGQAESRIGAQDARGAATATRPTAIVRNVEPAAAP